jgi:hypothetical protein
VIGRVLALPPEELDFLFPRPTTKEWGEGEGEGKSGPLLHQFVEEREKTTLIATQF